MPFLNLVIGWPRGYVFADVTARYPTRLLGGDYVLDDLEQSPGNSMGRDRVVAPQMGDRAPVLRI